MGQWGFYDDEGDRTADDAHNIEKKIIPKRFQDCYRYDLDIDISCIDRDKLVAELRKKHRRQLPRNASTSVLVNETRKPHKCSVSFETRTTRECYVAKRKWIEENLDKIGRAALRYVNDDDDAEMSDSRLVGIALYLARGWHSTPIYPAESGTESRGFTFPAALWSHFPERLRTKALASARNLQQQLDANEQGWSDIRSRRLALRNTVRLFEQRHN